MGTRIKSIIIAFFTLVLVSCGSYKLLEPQVTIEEPLTNYKYFYTKPTVEVNSVSGGTYGNQYGVYGRTSSSSINPADEISGYMMKAGFLRVPEISADIKDNGIIISYAISGRRSVGSWGAYTTEVTLQVLSAKTMKLIAVVTAEGIGSTETDDIRIAIERCMRKLLEQN